MRIYFSDLIPFDRHFFWMCMVEISKIKLCTGILSWMNVEHLHDTFEEKKQLRIYICIYIVSCSNQSRHDKEQQSVKNDPGVII